MHRVMVVDDEPIVRLALKSLADWESHGFDLCFEASNGKQALEIFIEHPDIDIIITDINMPIMDGLTLITKVRETTGDRCGIVVLSAYDDYNLVRQAFKLGAVDYILKTDMEPDNILKILKGVAYGPEPDGGLKSRAGLEDDKSHKKENFLVELIEQDNIRDPENRVKNLNLQFKGSDILVCCLLVDDFYGVRKRYDSSNLKLFMSSVYNAVYQILNEMKIGEALSVEPQQYVIIFSFENISLVQIREKAMEILGKVKYSLRNYVNINVSVGVSSVKSGFSAVRQLYKEAEANAALRFVLGKGRIIFPENAGPLVKKDISTIIGNEEHLRNSLKEINKERVLEELGKLFQLIKSSDYSKIDKIYACYMEIVFVLINFLKERGEDISNILGESINFYDALTRFETQEEVNEWIKGIAETAMDYMAEKKDIRVSRTVIRVQEFVRDNYNKDITLKAASDYVGLSESHLSCIFTKKTGETFTDYLTRIRIERAKELLETTNMKIYEVSVNVGYANAEHFSRVFKKLTGRSPNNYKCV